MKKIILLTVAVVITTVTFAQTKIMERDVPSSVMSEFKKRYPNVNTSNVLWEQHRNDYYASFNENNSFHVVEFDERGNSHRTRMKLKDHEVPKNVSDYVAKNHPEEKYKEIEKITERDGKVSYAIRMKDKEHYFDENGNYIKDKEKVHMRDKHKVKD